MNFEEIVLACFTITNVAKVTFYFLANQKLEGVIIN